jgi:hypothetical protein
VPSACARPKAPTPASQICCADSLKDFDKRSACACAAASAVFLRAVFLSLAMVWLARDG